MDSRDIWKYWYINARLKWGWRRRRTQKHSWVSVLHRVMLSTKKVHLFKCWIKLAQCHKTATYLCYLNGLFILIVLLCFCFLIVLESAPGSRSANFTCGKLLILNPEPRQSLGDNGRWAARSSLCSAARIPGTLTWVSPSPPGTKNQLPWQEARCEGISESGWCGEDGEVSPGYGPSRWPPPLVWLRGLQEDQDPKANFPLLFTWPHYLRFSPWEWITLH